MASEVVIYHGILNAIVFSILLFFDGRSKANSTLAALLLALGFNLVVSLVLAKSFYNDWPILHILPYGILFGLGPLLLIYVSQLLEVRYSWYHLLWIVGDYPHSIFHLVSGRTNQPYLFHELVDKWGLLSVAVLGYYLWIVYKMIIKYQGDLPNRLSNLEEQKLTWLAQLLKVFFVFVPISLTYWILVLIYPLDLYDRIIGFLLVNITIFWLGIGGLRQRPLRATQNNIGKPISTRIANVQHVARLVDSMEQQKFYLISDLNMRFLEDNLGLTSKEISHALNVGLGKNFYTFINEYRIREFEKKVKDNSNLTLVGVAFECGFSSKTTFQRVFKEIKGKSPSYWYGA